MRTGVALLLSLVLGIVPAHAAQADLAPEATTLTVQADDAVLGGQVQVHGLLLGSSQAPIVDAEVLLFRDDGTGEVPAGSFVTDASGHYEGHDVPVRAGATTYRVEFPGDEARAGAGATDVAQVRKPVELAAAQLPVKTTIGTPVTVRGTLRASGTGTPLGGKTLTVQRIRLQDFSVQSWTTTVAADGTFRVSDTPTTAGTVVYGVRFESDEEYATDAATVVTEVVKRLPRLALRMSRRIYIAGQTASVLVSDESAGSIRVLVSEAGRPWRAIWTGSVSTSGRWISFPIRFNTVVGVELAPTATHAGVAKTVGAPTGLSLRTTARGGVQSGPYRVYHRSADPVFVTAVKPVRSTCLRYEVQRYRYGAWRRTSLSTCRWTRAVTSSYSQASYALTGSQPVRVPYRVRPRFTGDTRNITTYGAWTYLYFR